MAGTSTTKDTMHPEDLLVIGKAVKAKGVKGWVKVHSYAESPETFRGLTELYRVKDNTPAALPIEAVDQHKQTVLIKFLGRDGRADIEDIIGATLYMPKAAMAPCEEGEYYWYQLIGMTVETDGGSHVSTLTQILQTGSSDVYVVKGKGKEVLVPALREVIQEVNVQEKRLIIRPTERFFCEDDL